MGEPEQAGKKIPVQKDGYDPVTGKKKKEFGLFYLPSRVLFLDYFSLGNPRCSDMELDWLRCADKTGLSLSTEKCKEQFDDYLECKFQYKSRHRFLEIVKKRNEDKSLTENVVYPDKDLFK
ncbi:NADH dehydrogenase [ubiquinone] iron-sulfur protein 5-like [Mya arenaria]|uniref:NADH dehydrogenase [ubiquinone] iron-sulfur protein 5-like n=1 Tax=Mya arenaria TaxID=6604 RepID=UPI0022DF0E94|nr:NADH dehydrogenase [ubiquinone] iron-sulfur protein 5-like [Mya arenaria]